jgi:hypothetical protein
MSHRHIIPVPPADMARAIQTFFDTVAPASGFRVRDVTVHLEDGTFHVEVESCAEPGSVRAGLNQAIERDIAAAHVLNTAAINLMAEATAKTIRLHRMDKPLQVVTRDGEPVTARPAEARP